MIYIHPSRGLQQGDPISLYLFLLCGHSLSFLITQAKQYVNIQGVNATRSSLGVLHLSFFDDSLLFCDASVACIV